jgi:homoserine acetyltransferase
MTSCFGQPSQIDAIEADPKWNHGRPTGMPLAGLRVVAEMSSSK